MMKIKSPTEMFFDYHRDSDFKVSQVFAGELWSVDETGRAEVAPGRFTVSVTVDTGEAPKTVEAAGASITEALVLVAKQMGSDWQGSKRFLIY